MCLHLVHIRIEHTSASHTILDAMVCIECIECNQTMDNKRGSERVAILRMLYGIRYSAYNKSWRKWWRETLSDSLSAKYRDCFEENTIAIAQSQMEDDDMSSFVDHYYYDSVHCD